MTPEQIVEDFTKQRDACVENIKKAEEEPTETTETEVVSEDVEDA